MIVPDTAALFVLSATLLALAPGPDNLYVLLHSMAWGARSGLAITLGLCSGLLVHTLVVAAGLAALLAASARVLMAIQLAGAAYLAWLGWQALRTGSRAVTSRQPQRHSAAALYRRGVLMNLSNPKIALFFVAFLPQFADPSRAMAPQLILLGLLFIATGFTVFALICLFAARIGRWVQRAPGRQRLLHRLAGMVLISMAARLLFTL